MAQTKLALELEQIYHRLYELRCEAIAVYWKDYVEPNPLENITRIQMLMMQYIADVAPCPLQKIITRTGLTKGAVSVATKKLAEKGILTITPGTADHREHIVDLTPHTRMHIRNIDALFENLLKERMPRYEQPEFETFINKLRHLNRVLSGADACYEFAGR